MCNRKFCIVSVVFVADVAVLDSAVGLLISYVTPRDVTYGVTYVSLLH